MDYYEEARSLCIDLRREGHIAEADAVMTAIEAGATATEILMRIRFELVKASPKAAGTTAARISRLVAEIDGVLQ